MKPCVPAISTPRPMHTRPRDQPFIRGCACLCLLLMLGASTAEETNVPETSEEPSPVPFEIRLLAEPQDREHIEVEYVSVESGGAVVDVPMLTEILVLGEDVCAARLLEEEGEVPRVEVRLREKAAARLGRATALNLGKQLAILYEYRLLAAPPVREVLSERVVFRGNGDDWPEQARELVARLNGEGQEREPEGGESGQ